ncbi:DUF3800 domain-containing protein [Undibacterium sp. TJN19]|uniref:DUF3800 domain-containing protein n=1 Tax=Undibacterium sp. TJN19 TaxID=3413055 RepID=UPI003BF0EA04
MDTFVEAYFDESGTHDGSPFLCVAGYIFEKNKSIELDEKWRKMLLHYGLPYFHMKECAHNMGVYKHLSREQCDLAAREAINLIKTYAARGIAVSLDVSSYKMIPPNGIFNNPYSFMCWQVFNGVHNWSNENNHNKPISYFFESGAEGFGDFQRATDTIFKYPLLKEKYRGGSVSFQNKTNAIQLQCADLLAWHWFTHNKRKKRGEKIRKDFRSLVDLKNVDVHHYDSESIVKWLNFINNQN